MSQSIIQKSLNSYMIILSGYLLITIVAAAIGLSLGSEQLDFSRILTGPGSGETVSVDFEIFFQQRMPRVLMALIAGGSLAVVGAVFQTLLHNPLASPYTLGMAGSSTVGAVLAMSIPQIAHLQISGFGSIQLFSIVGGCLSAIFIYRLAKRSGTMSMNTLLLTGVAIGIISSAMVMLIRYISSPHLLVSMDRWIMGGLDVTSINDLLNLMPFVLPGIAILVYQSLSLNHLVFGEELAIGHGVQVAHVQKWCFAGGAITTAAIISQTGPIAFVGLIVPHIVKKISGTDHRILIPASLFAGGGFLILCDTLARTIAAPAQMPVGIITAVIGGLFFIIILCSRN